MHGHPYLETPIKNAQYILMAILGAAIFAFGLEFSTWAWIAVGAYFAYAVIGIFWIMSFMCPYCALHGTMNCPAGYGYIAAKLWSKAEDGRFEEKFKKHVPIVVPLWFVPAAAGVWMLVRNFSWGLLALVVVFAVYAFVVLPLASIRFGCGKCPQRKVCPWMKNRS